MSFDLLPETDEELSSMLSPSRVLDDENIENSNSLARQALIEEGRQRMEAFRQRADKDRVKSFDTSLSSPRDHGERDDSLSPLARKSHYTENVPFTPVARGLQRQLEKLKRDELDLAQAEMSEQRRSVAQMRKEYEEYIAELEAKLQKAQERSEALQASSEKSDQARKGAESQLAGARTEAEQLRAKVKTLSSEHENMLRESVSRLAETHSERDADIAVLQSQLDSRNSTTQKLEQEVSRLQGALSERMTELAVSNEKNHTLQERTKMLSTESASQATAIERLQNDLIARDKCIRQLEQHVSEFDAVHANATELEQLCRQLHSQVDTQSADIEQHKEAAANSKLELDDVKEQLAFLEGENRRFKALLEKEQSATAEQALADAKEQIAILNRQLKTAHESVDMEKARTGTMLLRVEALEQELQQATVETEQMKTKAGILQEEIDRKAELISLSKDKMAQKNEQFEEVKARVEQSEKELHNFQSEMAKLAEKSAYQKRRNEQAKEELKLEVSARKKLESKLAATEEKHASELAEQARSYQLVLSEEKAHCEQRRIEGRKESSLSMVEQDLRDIREKLRVSQLGERRDPTGPYEGVQMETTLGLLVDRIRALEDAHLRQNRVPSPTVSYQRLIEDQKSTIHQLTLELEQSKHALCTTHYRMNGQGGFNDLTLSNSRYIPTRGPQATRVRDSRSRSLSSVSTSSELAREHERVGEALVGPVTKSTHPYKIDALRAELDQTFRRLHDEEQLRVQAEERNKLYESKLKDLFLGHFEQEQQRRASRPKKKASQVTKASRSRSRSLRRTRPKDSI